MICDPCRDRYHAGCIDTVRAAKEPKRKRGQKVLPRSSSCFCQHKGPQLAEPATGPAGE